MDETYPHRLVCVPFRDPAHCGLKRPLGRGQRVVPNMASERVGLDLDDAGVGYLFALGSVNA
jgi:hypothetical protein